MIYWAHLKSSKRAIFICSIGLIFALAILSGSILYIEVKNASIINDVVQVKSQSPYGIKIDLQTQDVNISFNKISSDIEKEGSKLLTSNQVDYLEPLELYYSLQGFTIPTVTIGLNSNYNWAKIPTIRYLDIVQLNDAIKKDLNQFLNANSSLPAINKSKSSIIQGFLLDSYFGPSTDPPLQFIKNTTLVNYHENPLINITQILTNKFADVLDSKKVPINVTGYGKIVNFDSYDPGQKKLIHNYNETYFPTLSKFLRIVPQNFLVGTSFLFVQNITQVLSKISPFHFDPSLHQNVYGITENIDGGYRLDFNKFDALTMNSNINQVDYLAKTLGDIIGNNNHYQKLNPSTTSLKVIFADHSELVDISNIVNEILTEMLLYSIPMLIVALLVTNYSFGLVQKRIISHSGIYKTRGASSIILFMFQSADYIAIVFLSALIGMILGIPLTVITSKTNGLLSFANSDNYNVLTSFLSVFPSLFVLTFFTSIIITFVTNIRRMIKLSRITIVESEMANVGEKLTPFWEAHYLDVLIFLYGVGSYVLINYYLYSPTTNGSILASGIFFLILFYPAPFAIVIGTILLANRFIPKILEIFGKYLWRSNGGLFAFTFKNIIRRKQSSTRAIILITTLITFLILFYTIPQSQIYYQRQATEYSLGADVQLAFPNTLIYRYNVHDYIDLTLNSINQSYGSYLSGITPVIISSYYSSSNQKTFNFIFINQNSYINGSSVNLYNLGLTHSLTSDLQNLHSSSNNFPILVQPHFLIDRNVTIGDSFTLDFAGFFNNFTVLDTFNEWPMTSRTALNYNTYYFVMDINYFYNEILPGLFSTPYASTFSGYILLNFKNKDDINKLAPDFTLLKGLKAQESNINLDWWSIESQLVYKFRLGQINIDLLASIIIAVTILLLFSYMQIIEREQEIFTERALGMKFRQLAFVFFIESLILLAIGIILASIISAFFLNILAVFLSGGLSIPRYVILVPYDTVYLTYFILIIVSSICAVIPAYYVTRQDVIRSFSFDK